MNPFNIGTNIIQQDQISCNNHQNEINWLPWDRHNYRWIKNLIAFPQKLRHFTRLIRHIPQHAYYTQSVSQLFSWWVECFLEIRLYSEIRLHVMIKNFCVLASIRTDNELTITYQTWWSQISIIMVLRSLIELIINVLASFLFT